MLEPGPIPIDPLPLGPRIIQGTPFTALGVAHLESLEGADAALGAIGGAVAEPLPIDLEVAYVTTIGQAEEELGAQPEPGATSPLFDLDANGEDVESLRVIVAPHLPPVEAPIEAASEEPPSPPGYQRTAPTDGTPYDPDTGCPIGWVAYADLCYDPGSGEARPRWQG